MINENLKLAIDLANVILPGGIEVFKDIKALFTKYPALTPEQAVAMIKLATSTADATYDAFIAEVQADQAAHPPTP